MTNEMHRVPCLSWLGMYFCEQTTVKTYLSRSLFHVCASAPCYERYRTSFEIALHLHNKLSRTVAVNRTDISLRCRHIGTLTALTGHRHAYVPVLLLLRGALDVRV
eukprot:7305535-Pyramimonas_sp.AAC.1